MNKIVPKHHSFVIKYSEMKKRRDDQMAFSGNYIVRHSGRKPGFFYIDTQGHYKVRDISKISGIEAHDLDVLYRTYSSEHSEEMDVYYFDSTDRANALIDAILERSGQKENGRLIYLTEKEIEYIRKALINEGSNSIHISSAIKDKIFNKLNN